MEHRTDLNDLLAHIDPASCSYQEWVSVGMALRHEGYTADDWDAWSARDSRRYHAGECARKWRSFNEMTHEIVTGGTIWQMAVDRGWEPARGGHELEWGCSISDEGVVVAPGWAETSEIHEPEEWHPGREAALYLETLFEPDEFVGFCMRSRYEEDRGKYVPADRGTYSMTAEMILERIKKSGDDLGGSFEDYNPEAGAWIRFNPLDGKGTGNRNVTEYRYALVESDSVEAGRQAAIIRELELPVAVLMFSGGKSVHAIVRIDALDYKEYQKRVEYLYSICEKNGLSVDTQNKNPSRLSRLPGCLRGGRKQFIIDTNIGKSSWNEWKDWIEAVNDSLPDTENLADVWDDMPELAGELIGGILRMGHKMLLAGPSKAGKSFLLIELAAAIAEGVPWLGHPCTQGRVLYINLELDRASCLHRFRDVYTVLGVPPRNLRNIEIWNLRGKAAPMDQLVPKLIRRAQKKDFAAVIIDPIYKVITGDENSAEQMSRFCGQFDRICAELGCAAVYCHHHSKGAQGGKKSMDRASGSGVFARDPDAQLDMIELPVSDDLRAQQSDRAVCDEIVNNGWLARADEHWEDHLGQDDLLVARTLINYVENKLDDEWVLANFRRQISAVRLRMERRTAWQIDATLREFPGFDPVNLWFDYPVHRLDGDGVLKDIAPEEAMMPHERAQKRRKESAKKNRIGRDDRFIIAYQNLALSGEEVTMRAIAEALDMDPRTIGGWLGTGNKRIDELAEQFEKYQKEDSKNVYVRLKTKQCDGATDTSTSHDG